MNKFKYILLGILVATGLSVGAVTLLTVPQGGTGAGTFPVGQCLKGNGTSAITTGSCGAGGSGSDVNWTFFNGSGIYVSTTTNQVVIGGNSTTTKALLEIKNLLGGSLLTLGSTTLQNFSFVNATGTSATTTSFFSDIASSTNLFSTNARFGGYLRVGSALAPNNATAGDITGVRLSLGNTTMNSAYLDVRGTLTNTTNGAIIADNFINTIAPTSDSLTEFRALNFQNTAGGNSSSGIVLDQIEAGHLEGARFGSTQDGLINSIKGLVAWGAVPASGASRELNVTAIWGIQTFGSTLPSGTSFLNASTTLGVDATAVSGNSYATTTDAIALRANNNGSGNNITNSYGLDVAAMTRGTTKNTGIRIALPSGATNNYALNLSDTTGVTGGGITFGTDANLYRSAANVLRTNDDLVIDGSATTTNLSATTASTTNLILSGTGYSTTNCLQVSTAGLVSGTGSACGAGGGTSAGNSKWGTTTIPALGISPNGAIYVGIGTSSPFYNLTLSTSTAPQLALTDGSLTSNQWTMRNAGGVLYFASSSPTTFATSSTAALSIDSTGAPGIAIGVTGSSTLQAFTFTNATGTSATTTGFAIAGLNCTGFTNSGKLTTNSTGGVICGNDIGTAGAGASSTLLSDNNLFSGNNTYTSSTTFQNFTFLNGTGTSATTTSLFTTTASTSALYLSTGTGCLQSTNGLVSSTGSACGSGGGSGGGTWSTTTSQVSGQLINYPNNNTDVVTIGSNATTSAKFWFDPNVPKYSFSGNGTTTGKFTSFDEIKGTYFTSTSTSATSTIANALQITAGQTTGSASENTSDGTLNIENTNSNALGLQVYTNNGVNTDSPLVLFRSDNTAFDDGVLWLLQDGTGGGAYNIKNQGPAPQIEWVEADQASPAGKFEDGVNGDIRYIASRNSGDTSFENAFEFNRFANGGALIQLGSSASTFTGGLLSLASSTLQNFTFVNATGTKATTTSFFSTNLAFTTGNGTTLTATGLGTFGNLLVSGSTTLQNFTFTNATGTSATTTNFFATNLFGTTGNLSTLLLNSSSTLQNFTFLNATGTSATTTSLFSTTASSTNLFTSKLGIATSVPSAALSVVGNIYQNGRQAHFGPVDCGGAGVMSPNIIGMEFCGSDNTTLGGVQPILGGNLNSGANAWGGIDLVNNLGDATVTHHFGMFYNSSNYTDASFGTEFANKSMGIIQNTDGLLDLVSSTSTEALNAAGIRLITGGTSAGATGTGNERMRVTYQGYIGMGTTSPLGSVLTIASSSQSQLRLADGGGSSAGWNFRNAGGNFYLATSSPTTFATSTVSALSIDANGLLTVPSLKASSGTFCLQADTAGVISNTGSACGSGGGSGGNSKFATSTFSWLTISPNGGANVDVGIGTSTSPWQLTISSSTRPQLALTDATGSSNIWTMRNAGGSFYLSTSSPTTFATSSLAWFSILGNGNIGIGTSTPSSALTVNGAILSIENAPATTTAITINLATSSTQNLIQLGTSATTITLTGILPGQGNRIVTCNPAAAAGAITWATLPANKILWSNGVVPTQTTTANKCDVWTFTSTQATSTTATSPILLGGQVPNF